MSLARRSSHKLARRFYGPFQIIERIGAVAYRLQLPISAKIHDVFHVSKLKRFVGDPIAVSHNLPIEFLNQHPLLEPDAILKQREVLKLGRSFKELLVQWKGQSAADATWEDAKAFFATFPEFILEDKDVSQEGAIVAKGSPEHQQDGSSIRRSNRWNRGKNVNKFEDFVMSAFTLIS